MIVEHFLLMFLGHLVQTSQSGRSMLKGISRQRRIDSLAIDRKKNVKQNNPIKPRQSSTSSTLE